MMFREYVHALLWTYRHVSGKLKVPELEVISRYLSADSVCFDVGAHGGSWSRGLARIISRGHVYSFEALPYYADVLQKTMKLLGQERVTVLNKAVAEKNGSVQIVRQDCDGNKLTGETHVAIKNEEVHETLCVSSVSLDSFWQENVQKQVDFIKCDVEGFELFVLKGARKLIHNCCPVFYNELNAEWCKRYDYTPADVFNFFHQREYVPFYISVNEGLIAVDMKKHVNRDVLFLPKEKAII